MATSYTTTKHSHNEHTQCTHTHSRDKTHKRGKEDGEALARRMGHVRRITRYTVLPRALASLFRSLAHSARGRAGMRGSPARPSLLR